MNESENVVGTKEMLALCVGGAAIPAPIRQRGEPIDPHRGRRASPPAPVVEALGHARAPIAGDRPDHRGGQGQWVASALRDNPVDRAESRLVPSPGVFRVSGIRIPLRAMRRASSARR